MIGILAAWPDEYLEGLASYTRARAFLVFLRLAKGDDMRKRSKTEKAKEHAAMLARFPKGGTDTLGGQVCLGSSYRRIDSKEFSSIPRKRK